MKTTLIFRLFLLIVSLFTFLPYTATADITKWGLPDGATARLGKGKINDITYSPDGSLLTVAGSIGIWLHDAYSGQELTLITEQADGVNSVSFSPDNKTIASGSDDGIVLLWRVMPTDDVTFQRRGGVNGDGTVNIADLVLVASNFGQTGQNAAGMYQSKNRAAY